MPSDQSAQSKVTVPSTLQQQHPELIALILGSESMNDEERQYWVNILPVMTPEQIENLRQILKNEKDQLAAIDAKYSKEMEHPGSGAPLEEIGQRRRAQRAERSAAEEGNRAGDQAREEEILRAISSIEQ